MKRNVLLFICAISVALLIVPLVNILSAPNLDSIRWRDKEFLYNVDFVSRLTARVLYPLGISTDPDQVIIGRGGWLYLGDFYEQTLSVDRRPPVEADVLFGKRVGAATEAWDAYLSSKGVKVFRVMVGPNKHAIYPEYMPTWAFPASPNVTDALFAGTGTRLYVDLRGPLLTAKQAQVGDLYFKTDTHWNMLGASVAFRAFGLQVAETMPDLKWPSEKAYEQVRVDSRAGGDLAGFLRLKASFSDVEPVMGISKFPVETTQYDFDTNQIIHQGGNPAVPASSKPILIKSVGALNNRKVLWLRDSFGGGMSPLMAATFSETLQIHWTQALRPNGRFIELVEKWKPDYVFITVVERATRSNVFTRFPPLVLLPENSNFKSLVAANYLNSNSLIADVSTGDFKVSGRDPYVNFVLSNPILPSAVNYLSIDFSCADGSQSAPLQFFWRSNGQSYSEERSAQLAFPAGRHLIDLRTIPNWSAATLISHIRVDVGSDSSCANFKLSNPSLGVVPLEFSAGQK